MRHYSDIHYNTHGLSLAQETEMLHRLQPLAHHWWVDRLASVTRERIDMTFEEIMDKFDEKAHFVFIHRRGYKDNKFTPWHLEVGFTTGGPSPYFFLWLELAEDMIQPLAKEFKLKVY